MSDVNSAALPLSHVLLRSSLDRDRRLRVPYGNQDHRRRPDLYAVRLVAHLATTSLVFLALTSLAWIVSLDAGVSGVVVFIGPWNYLKKVIGGES